MTATSVAVSVCLLTVVILLCHLQIASSCSCLPQHTQHHFCNSHFVIKVRIKSVKMVVKKGFSTNDLQQLPLPVLTSAERSYKVWVREVYKGHQFIAEGSHPELYTSFYESMCGVANLEVGKTYVIMGKISAAKLKFTNCNWREPWEKISKNQRRGLRYWYEKNCDSCKIDACGAFSPCSQQEKERAASGESCLWDPMSGQCQNLHSSCVKHDGGACRWFKTTELMRSKNCTKSNQKVLNKKKDFFHR
ncbi:metalloproteinase inhibitor 3-like [Asterias rubens]|uniref:metalloproteinase inhibitor 3-like n=1 Tax=Asterias rubens TaxID=7604 RepID=UPI0014558497|nr:metalloproteinase inhibitor 3-like [Asterias rubens]